LSVSSDKRATLHFPPPRCKVKAIRREEASTGWTAEARARVSSWPGTPWRRGRGKQHPHRRQDRRGLTLNSKDDMRRMTMMARRVHKLRPMAVSERPWRTNMPVSILFWPEAMRMPISRVRWRRSSDDAVDADDARNSAIQPATPSMMSVKEVAPWNACNKGPVGEVARGRFRVQGPNGLADFVQAAFRTVPSCEWRMPLRA